MSAPLGMAPRFDPAEEIAREQEYRRNALAERLLEVGLEETAPEAFTDTSREDDEHSHPTLTLKEWYVKHAEAALAAAEVIYPEVPEQVNMTAGEYTRLQPEILPPAVQGGVQSITPAGSQREPGEAGRQLTDADFLTSHGLEG